MELRRFAKLLAQVDSTIPFIILAFFPEHKLIDVPSPNFQQMIEAYHAARDAGLKNIKLGNIGRFARTEKDYEILRELDVL
ncbi:MAG: hypothetical protein QMD36_05680 [Candidatus Aenigmarchaeota archaeon]|nr:hypothetical protein [Candidatus Aenigmarchaeota archaeon]